ncbi:MAG: outer membrane beta-barrel protein [Flavobacteriales bacterium]|nr:outer membrane beta-barrel protein [Flavobacteriales bacterium]
MKKFIISMVISSLSVLQVYAQSGSFYSNIAVLQTNPKVEDLKGKFIDKSLSGVGLIVGYELNVNEKTQPYFEYRQMRTGHQFYSHSSGGAPILLWLLGFDADYSPKVTTEISAINQSNAVCFGLRTDLGKKPDAGLFLNYGMGVRFDKVQQTTTKRTDGNPTEIKTKEYANSNFFFQFSIGSRIKLNEQIGLNGELGISNMPFVVGLDYKLNKK